MYHRRARTPLYRLTVAGTSADRGPVSLLRDVDGHGQLDMLSGIGFSTPSIIPEGLELVHAGDEEGTFFRTGAAGNDQLFNAGGRFLCCVHR